MNTLVNESLPDLGVDQENVPLPEENVRTHVCGLLTSLYPRPETTERRSQRRYPFPYLVQLTPVGEEGTEPIGETVVVVGKHLSERGLGFYHLKPLPYRRMIVSIEVSNGSWVGFLIDLTWCRFTKQGWYESGGRFLEVVPSPVSNKD
ncbi:MAG: hypothetical protein JW818_17815 [Pirellulales bacterium]|nr:hypothetical protein [Pirellulales bacterium]